MTGVMDRQTDRQTDGITIAMHISHLHIIRVSVIAEAIHSVMCET